MRSVFPATLLLGFLVALPNLASAQVSTTPSPAAAASPQAPTAPNAPGQEKVFLLNNGRVVTGTVVADDGKIVTVRTAGGAQEKLTRADIDEIRARAQSSPSDQAAAEAAQEAGRAARFGASPRRSATKSPRRSRRCRQQRKLLQRLATRRK